MNCLPLLEMIVDSLSPTSENFLFDTFVISTKCNCLEYVNRRLLAGVLRACGYLGG